jgi:hypothetical protein
VSPRPSDVSRRTHAFSASSWARTPARKVGVYDLRIHAAAEGCTQFCVRCHDAVLAVKSGTRCRSAEGPVHAHCVMMRPTGPLPFALGRPPSDGPVTRAGGTRNAYSRAMTPQMSRPRSRSKHQPFSADAPPNRKVTLYVRDPELWARARRVSGRGGLSEWVQDCLRRCLDGAHLRTSPPSVIERARRLHRDVGALVDAIKDAQIRDRAPRPRSPRARRRVP